MSNPERFLDSYSYYEEDDLRIIEDDSELLGQLSLSKKYDDKYFFDFDEQDNLSENPENIQSGVSTDINERAKRLSNALHNYMLASRSGGLASAIESGKNLNHRFNAGYIPIAKRKENRYKIKAKAEFFAAYGVYDLMADGFDSNKVKEEAQEDARLFVDAYSGQNNAGVREKFQKQLKQQVK